MSVKASISLTETQDAFARELVAQGRFPSMSAVLQHGLELMRDQSTTTEALRVLLDERRRGDFVSLDAGRADTEAMLARKRADLGL
ncbi:type II toxin-antitoxin system ParD family antitoxin [Maritimibacter sp. UBA3975]|uniref:ribbon-helix-helix domain-containing protein n=1 Tax=Maritimibacter sp. UBA3975 TaxID=1946833 RepID=UPI000C0A1BD6|nr:type II toxin-antitoxin system ParD family antitoxin [Maritimibacter sp. UBA3975]MAM61320.1 type II toxin-antitoxin system ParD family antitoxin [Maritimibacter sp.]|tara:strand:- start:10826 stop:11083 length:258 start_codon:yes stop_codon:yes gene_type:complete